MVIYLCTKATYLQRQPNVECVNSNPFLSVPMHDTQSCNVSTYEIVQVSGTKRADLGEKWDVLG